MLIVNAFFGLKDVPEDEERYIPLKPKSKWGWGQYCSVYILLHAAKQDYSRGDTSKRQPILLQFDNKT
jgi:hypothetical protein